MDTFEEKLEVSLWKVTELDLIGSDWENRAISVATLIRDFFNWLEKCEGFDFVVIARNRSRHHLFGFVGWGGRVIENEVLPNMEHIEKRFPDIVRSAICGYELVVSINTSKDELVAFYSKYGYSVASQYTWASELPALNKALGFALTMEADLLCIFGHDADPIYLLSLEQSGTDHE